MMRTFFLAGFVLALSISILGQKQKTGADDPSEKAPGSRGSDNKNSKNTASESFLSAGTNLEVELQSMLDVRKSNVGDEVILKTTKAIKQNGETIVPKGA